MRCFYDLRNCKTFSLCICFIIVSKQSKPCVDYLKGMLLQHIWSRQIGENNLPKILVWVRKKMHFFCYCYYCFGVGLLVGWLAGWLVILLIGWLVGYLVDWLAGRLISLLVCWLIGMLVGYFFGLLTGWLVDWLYFAWNAVNSSLFPWLRLFVLLFLNVCFYNSWPLSFYLWKRRHRCSKRPSELISWWWLFAWVLWWSLLHTL